MTLRKVGSKPDETTKHPGKMRLYLMRHGIAIDREDPDCPEETQRFLTPKGIERTRAAAFGLAQLGVQPEVLLTSPYLRAVQTGEIVCEALDIDPKRLRTTEALKSSAEPKRLIEELEGISEREVICFGHAPQMDDFIAHAVHAGASFTSLKKAGVACLELDSLSPLSASLVWLLPSKVLRSLGD
jgi:phosphohistidine phosphatase